MTFFIFFSYCPCHQPSTDIVPRAKALEASNNNNIHVHWYKGIHNTIIDNKGNIRCEFESYSGEMYSIHHLFDKLYQWLAASKWFYPRSQVSSNNKTDSNDITEREMYTNHEGAMWILLLVNGKITMGKLKSSPLL
jgi:hypothetical protein